jgi:hypothetical protein
VDQEIELEKEQSSKEELGRCWEKGRGRGKSGKGSKVLCEWVSPKIAFNLLSPQITRARKLVQQAQLNIEMMEMNLEQIICNGIEEI